MVDSQVTSSPPGGGRWKLWLLSVGYHFVLPVLIGISAYFVPVWITAATDTDKTEVKYFRPYAAEAGRLADGIRVVRTTDGPCLASSIVDQAAPEARRCFSENGPEDPCFEYPPERVVCFEAPLDKSAVVVRPKESLGPTAVSTGDMNRRTTPWAVELTDGTRCVFVSGPRQLVGGSRTHYLCAGEADGESGAAGMVNDSKGIWTIRYEAPQSSETEVRPVRTAWF